MEPTSQPSDAEVPGLGPPPRWVVWVVIAIPVVAYAELFVTAAANVPYLDDFDTILGFLNRFDDASGALARLELLFSQHMEHRLALPRLAALGVQATVGAVDFAWLNAIGNLALIGIALALWAARRREGDPRAHLWLFAPVPFLLFQPQHWDSLLWSTSSLANFPVVLLALAALLALQGPGRLRFAAAVAAATGACFTQANGLFVLPLGLALLWADGRRLEAGLWLGFGAVLAAGYFVGYAQPGLNPPLSESLAAIGRNALYVLYFAGSAGGLARPLPSAVVGLAVIASVFALAALGHGRREPALMGLLVFLLLTAVANAIGRGHIAGAVYPLQSPRYQFFSSVFLATTYWCWIGRAGPRLARACVRLGLAGALALCAASHALHRDDVERLSARLERSVARWPEEPGRLVYPHPRKAARILAEAVERDVYAAPGSAR